MLSNFTDLFVHFLVIHYVNPLLNENNFFCFVLDLKELKSSIYKVANSKISVVLPDIKHIDELKRAKRPWEIYLEGLDTTGELYEDKLAVDHVKHSRRVRAEIISKNLDDARYIEYSKARNVSFVNRHRHKFSEWVVPDGNFFCSL